MTAYLDIDLLLVRIGFMRRKHDAVRCMDPAVGCKRAAGWLRVR